MTGLKYREAVYLVATSEKETREGKTSGSPECKFAKYLFGVCAAGRELYCAPRREKVATCVGKQRQRSTAYVRACVRDYVRAMESFTARNPPSDTRARKIVFRDRHRRKGPSNFVLAANP